MPIHLPKLTKKCETDQCKKMAMRGERYCEFCRHYLFRQMERDGYLKEVPGQPKGRDLS